MVEREHRTDDEEQRPADPFARSRPPVAANSSTNTITTKIAERVALPVEVGRGALLHRLGDVLHLRGALAGGQHLLEQHVTDGESSEGDHGDHDDDAAITSGELEALREELPGHPSSW